MFALMTDLIPDLLPQGGSQCFPLYTYAVDGAIRRDNITDWALAQFQEQYGPSVTKRDIFHYVYALLHHPEYRDAVQGELEAGTAPDTAGGRRRGPRAGRRT